MFRNEKLTVNKNALHELGAFIHSFMEKTSFVTILVSRVVVKK